MKAVPNQKSNLVFIVPAIAYEGISKQVLLQIEALLQLGYKVNLIVLSTIDETVTAAFAPSLHLVNIITLHQSDPYLSTRSLNTSVAAAWSICKVLLKLKPQIVISHAPYAHFLVRLAILLSLGKLSAIKTWQYFHSLQYLEFPLNSTRRKLLNLLDKVLASKYDYGHIYVSKAVKNDVRQSLIDLRNCKVIYNALPPSVNLNTSENQKIPSTKNRVYTIVIPGRLEKMKGQLWFLDVFKEFITNENLDPSSIKLILSGGGSMLKEINEKIEQSRLEHIVTISGSIDNTASELFLIRADLVIIPSFIEGFGLVLLEALMNEKIILSSDAGGLKEVLEHNKTGFLFKASDSKDCLRKLTYIYKNRDNLFVDKMAISKTLNTKFSFEKHIQEIVSIIENG